MSNAVNVALAIFALAGLAVFLGIIIWRVPEPALIIVFVFVFLLGACDFWLELRSQREENGR